jgi:hypothetical protein
MISKDERRSIGISAVASIVGMCGILAPVGWYVVKPTLVASVSSAMADELDSKIAQQVAPLNQGFKAIIQSNINNIRRAIARMEFARDDPETPWTAQQADDLAQLTIDLAAQQAALDAILDEEARRRGD